MLRSEAEGGRPVDRPRRYEEAERRRRRGEKGDRWYRREARGTTKREGVFIIPPTPGSVLAKAWRKVCQEEIRGTTISLGVTERGGRRLGQELGSTVPGKSERKHCGREKCFTCNTGSKGVCRRTGVGYQIDCTVCGSSNNSNSSNNNSSNTLCRYAGETGKNLYMRGCNYVSDVEKKKANKPLWKHILDKHQGVMRVPMFSHFKMELVQIFSKPQRRKADEGVRIYHLDPDNRMNSKNEFMQGTNLYLQPVRGVGL